MAQWWTKKNLDINVTNDMIRDFCDNAQEAQHIVTMVNSSKFMKYDIMADLGHEISEQLQQIHNIYSRAKILPNDTIVQCKKKLNTLKCKPCNVQLAAEFAVMPSSDGLIAELIKRKFIKKRPEKNVLKKHLSNYRRIQILHIQAIQNEPPATSSDN